MRAIELFESDDISMKEAWKLIQRDCQPYLSLKADDLYLYRGIAEIQFNPRTSFRKLPVRQDRRPLDSNIDDHNITNAAMQAAGFKAYRGNSIFCRTTHEGLGNYGLLHMIFPIGNFNISWSPSVGDWNNNGPNIINDNIEVDEDTTTNKKNSITLSDGEKVVYDNLVDWFEDHYKDNDLQYAMEDSPNSEIMINCKEYYAVLFDSSKLKNNIWDSFELTEIIEHESN